MAESRFAVTEDEAVALIERTAETHGAVHFVLGSGALILDLAKPDDRATAEWLIASREARNA